MKYSIITFGCRVNQADSLAIEAELCEQGAGFASADQADVVIVNTCSVTASADQGARQMIRRIARNNPQARIVVTGCYATRCPDAVAALPGVDQVVPNDGKSSFVRTLKLRTSEARTPEPRDPGTPAPRLAPGLMGRTAWTLRVQTGCEEKCSYCIIPSTRGASRSRTLDDILDEVRRVIGAGYKEIAITGVHLGSYGRDLMPPTSLAELLATLVARTFGSAMFRVSSLEPMDFPLEILELNLAPHFHLPLQHASNRILDLMQRPYSIEYYRALVGTIRDRLPHASIGSDVIAGFPGETDEDFDVLTTYLETSPLTHLHVFPYSDRPGTLAATLPNKVHGTVTKARAQCLREISRELSGRFRASQRDTRRRALTIEDGSAAITDNYIRISIPPGCERNEWIEVTL